MQRFQASQFHPVKWVVLASFAAVITSGGCNSLAVVGLPLSPAPAQPQSSSQPAGPEPIRAQYAAGEVTTLCQAAIDAAKSKFDAIAAIPPSGRTTDNTLLAFELANAELGDATTPLTFMGYVSADNGVNSEGSACEQNVGQFGVDVSTRKDLYLAIKDAQPRNTDESRLLFETLKGFEDNGLKLPDDQLAKVKDLEQKLAVAQSQFSSNLNNDRTTVSFSKDELDGASDDFIARAKKNSDGSLLVTTSEADYSYVMTTAKKSETRRKMMDAYNNRAADKNVPLLENAILLREQIAALMGYATWADYRIRGRMASDSKTVFSFLGGLKDKLAQRNRDDLNHLLQYKKTLDPSADHVDAWDISYLSTELQKRDYSLDEDQIREYFPADVVINGIFAVYSKMLGVRFVPVDGAKVWSPDVTLYRIEQAAGASDDGRLIGYFYTDFFPRPGKYSHAASFTLISGRVLPSAQYNQTSSAIVANLTPPGNGKPSLMSHDDVVTVFHEFGHIMHQTLTRAPYASLSGSNVAQDFVEAPSQMLENWPWDASVLAILSGHYTDHSRKLPADLLQKMSAARDFNQGYNYSRQLMLALLDMDYHTASGPVDTTAVYANLYTSILGIPCPPNNHFQAGFGHLMGGYDAGYYGYLWSQVYAEDMFSQFQAKGLLSPEEGMHYRKTILEKGNMVEAIDVLREFLGREPSQDAFFQMLHITPDTAKTQTRL